MLTFSEYMYSQITMEGFKTKCYLNSMKGTYVGVLGDPSLVRETFPIYNGTLEIFI